jgi:hypothetical protein
VNELLQLEDYIDLIIPRGGEELIHAVVANSKIPVIKHYKGVCHVYVEADASLEMAERICFNAKVQRPSVCNAMETLLVHEAIAAKFLPPMIARFQAAGVEIRGCERTSALAPGIVPAREADWSEEYLDLILAVRVVRGLDDAIAHIERYGSEHTETIVTESYQKSREFVERVNSSAVLVNASTRFNDGSELGLHYELSMNIGELVLLPAVRRAPKETLIIADGFSCREQIRQGTDREALHTAQVLQLALGQSARSGMKSENYSLDVSPYPEKIFSHERARERAQANRKVACALGGAITMALLLWATKRKRRGL